MIMTMKLSIPSQRALTRGEVAHHRWWWRAKSCGDGCGCEELACNQGDFDCYGAEGGNDSEGISPACVNWVQGDDTVRANPVSQAI